MWELNPRTDHKAGVVISFNRSVMVTLTILDFPGICQSWHHSGFDFTLEIVMIQDYTMRLA